MSAVYTLIAYAFGFSIMNAAIMSGVSILKYKSFMNTLTDRFTVVTAVIVVAASAVGIYLTVTSWVRLDELRGELNVISSILIVVAVSTATLAPFLILNAKLQKKMKRHNAGAAS